MASPDPAPERAPARGPSSTPADLGALLGAIARRDRGAFERLYGLTAGKLLGVSLRILRDRSLAEDVVQDAFVKIWQSAGTYSAEAGRPMTWLITIVRNRAIDVVRSRRASPVSAADGGEDVLATLAEPRDREADFVERDRIALCLEQLDETHRRCFVEAYVEGYSRDELAARFDRPVNTIKTWLHRSAASLRTCLDAS